MFNNLSKNVNESIIFELSKGDETGVIGGYCLEGFPIYYVNEKMIQMLGYDDKKDFIKGINGLVSNTIHPDDLGQVVKDLNNGVFYEGMTYKTTYRMPKKDGSWFWTVDRGKVIKSDDGRLAIISICSDMTDFVDRHNELEQQNKLSKFTFENMPGGYHRCANKDGFPFIYISRRFLDIFGWTKEEIETKFDNRFINMLHPDDRKFVEERIKSIDLDNLGFNNRDVTYRMLGKKGYVWVSDATSFIKNDDNSFYHGTITDISKLVETKNEQNEKLKKTNLELEEMKDIISASRMGTWCIEFVNGKLPRLKADERMLQLLGIEDEELSQEEAYEFWFSRICPEALDSVLASVENMKKGKIDENTYLWNHPKLGKRYVRCGGTSHKIKDGYLLRGYHYDVDKLVKEQKHQHAVLKNALYLEKKHAEIIETLATLYKTSYLIDLTTHNYEVVKGINENAYQGKVGNFDDAIKGIVNKVVVEDMYDDLMSFLNLDTLNDRLKDIDTITFEHLNKDGNWFLSRFIVKQRQVDGDVLTVLFVSRDITIEKKYELELQEQLRNAAIDAKKANISKTNFLRRMSHDIRTPLNGIIGLLNLADKYENNPEKLKEYKIKMLHSADYLLELVNNVLDISKLESGTVDLENKAFCMDDVLNKVRATIETSANENDIKLSTNTNITHHYLIGSSIHLHRALMNLASNGVKYNKKGGSLNMSCDEIISDEKSALYRFVFEDSGLGMSKEFQKHAFEPFTQENKQTTTGFSGSGLGLSIVKDIVEKMDGTINLESEEDVGTKFIITIPFDIDHSIAITQDDSNDVVNLKGKRALLVEDNELNMEIARLTLEGEGLIIDEARNGEEALDKFEESTLFYYDYIFMDVMMPVMDGIEATKKIRNLDRKDKNVSILAMTANAFIEDKRACLNAGMNGHIAKPINIKNILEVIKNI